MSFGAEWIPIIRRWILWVAIPSLVIGYCVGACRGTFEGSIAIAVHGGAR